MYLLIFGLQCGMKEMINLSTASFSKANTFLKVNTFSKASAFSRGALQGLGGSVFKSRGGFCVVGSKILK